jgi:hypothetical protein
MQSGPLLASTPTLASLKLGTSPSCSTGAQMLFPLHARSGAYMLFVLYVCFKASISVVHPAGHKHYLAALTLIRTQFSGRCGIRSALPLYYRLDLTRSVNLTAIVPAYS